MSPEDISAILDTRPRGTFYTVEVLRPAKVRKGVTVNIQKHSWMQGQITDYSNRTPVNDAVEAGERDAPELPKHIATSFFEGKIRFWRGFNNKEYFPVCITGNAPKAEWLLDGKPVQRDDIKEYLLASELGSKPTKETTEDKGQVQFCAITVENVLAIR